MYFGSVWTGGHGFGPTGVFKWSTEVRLDHYDYQNWAHEQPDDGNGLYLNGENCVCQEPWRNFAWNDVRCTSLLLSICEKEVVAV